jgi:hypothetical protein
MTEKQAFWRQRNFAIMRVRGMLAQSGYLKGSSHLLESEREALKDVNKILRRLVDNWPENSKKVKGVLDEEM